MPFARKLEGLTRKADATIGRLSHVSTRQLGHRALFLTVNLLVAGVVMSLPFVASATSHPSAQASVFSASIGSTSLAPADGGPQVARVTTQARGGTITAGRNPLTLQAQAEAVAPIQEYTLSSSDTVW